MDDKNKVEITPEEVDETALDKALEDSINQVKAGKEATPEKEEPKVEEPNDEVPEANKLEDPSTPPVDEPKKDEYDYRIPNKGKFESDESYEKRIELMDLVKKRKLAKTDEARQQISEQIKTTKGQLKNLNGTDKFINPLNNQSEKEAEKPKEPEDELLEADKERLRQLGGATREDVEELLKKQQLAVEVKSTLDRFIDRHAELKDEDTREVFFDFVDSNYNWQNKSGKDLMTVLELARESMFKPSETITERVLKGANVQEKVNAMQFPGGTITKTDYSPEMRKSIDELTATGLSEEKALELLSE
jgi:hypothetical protein